MMAKLADEIIKNNKRLSKNDDLDFLIDCDLDELSFYANKIRQHFRDNSINFCTIINGKGGGCKENCKFCAQSAHNHTGFKIHSFLETDEILDDCKKRAENGIDWYSIVTAGRKLSGDDFDKAVKTFNVLSKECDIKLCASFGLLDYDDFMKLKQSGVTRIHANIETSRNFFPNICTTHTFDDKINCIKAAKKAGLEVCSGGIIGMGESFNDRIDMALELAELDVNSIPINALLPVKGTALENYESLTEDEIIRTIGIFRFINPEKEIRLAAGRALIKEGGKRGFLSGADATITGDMLTTTGTSIKSDFELREKVKTELDNLN